jgi:RNA polymerase sigma factor (sigma-70 family)
VSLTAGLNDGQESSVAGSMAASAKAGDREALRALWHAHRRWVAAVLLAYKPRHVELDDLIQEVAVSVVSNIGGLRDVTSLRPWLRTIAINAARASARRIQTRSHLRLVDDAGPRQSAGADEHAARGDESQHLLRMTEELPDLYREPLLLQAVHGMSVNQVAAVLDLPVTTVETRLARARRMLRQQVAGNGELPTRRRGSSATAASSIRSDVAGDDT